MLARAIVALCWFVALGCQGAQQWDSPAKGMAADSGLPDVRLDGSYLNAQAFVAEAAFLFPAESRSLVHALVRSEFARLEANRLQLELDPKELQAALEQSVAGLEASLPAGQNLDDWALQRFDRSWVVVNETLRRHLAENQLFQLCARAHAMTGPRAELQMLTSRDQQQAQNWARQLKTGASASSLAALSLDPGPQGDASLPPLPMALPAPLGEWLCQQKSAGTVFGPFQFGDEQVWRVVYVRRLLAGLAALPPISILIEDLSKNPVSPLEERAWFDAMAKRYNAVENLPAIQAPAAAFVRSTT
ncbi:MAG: hypothetical protein HQ519_07770 [Planctomycetes bacterium]|nr:hypothetical protein [Planctomycetota bacterium]